MVLEGSQSQAGRYPCGTEGGGVFEGEALRKRNYVLWLCDNSGGEPPVTIFAIAIPRNNDASPRGKLGVGALLHNTGCINTGNERRLPHNSGRPGEGECVLIVERRIVDGDGERSVAQLGGRDVVPEVGGEPAGAI